MSSATAISLSAFHDQTQVVLTSLAASPRCGDDLIDKPILDQLPTFKSPNLDALLLDNSYLYLECELMKVVEGFDEFGLIAGKITGAFVAPDSKIYSEIDAEEMIRAAPLLSYLAYGRFAEISRTYAFPFPSGFESGK